ncbi:MAG: hypothetical protein N3H30_00420 [Candidatus Micrarchaeota archaeon]|nr:hypothetical protein [Candidatus Micrarchaeota archaeon]
METFHKLFIIALIIALAAIATTMFGETLWGTLPLAVGIIGAAGIVIAVAAYVAPKFI